MKDLVCVTGASGFIASWLVKFLLKSGYQVRGVVRSPDDKQKTGHLERFEGAQERLTLVKGDLLNKDSLFAAIDGCSGVFHTACPVPSCTSTNPEVEVLDPAIKGTLNVLEACTKAKVKRVVMTSSGAAVAADPDRPSETVLDENCWSNEDYLRKNNHWYMLGKTLGEKAAWDYSQKNGLNLVVICPTLVLGPLLQSAPNASSLVVLKLLNGSSDSYENTTIGVVDVKDVAQAHLLAYEIPAASGRYLCCNEMVTKSTMVEILRQLYPGYTLPSRCIEVQISPKKFSTKKLQDLGLKYTPVETTLKETVDSLKEKGHF
ncbi:hypothetical protein L7F22_054381 [Adiantum nelumboides]|nr:hypothetical protein [Adiantum nelumboides]